jgi:hypothetical protein
VVLGAVAFDPGQEPFGMIGVADTQVDPET